MYHEMVHMSYTFAGKTKNMMETERIKSPEGVRNLMAELWANHVKGGKASSCLVYMVDLPDQLRKRDASWLPIALTVNPSSWMKRF